MTTHPLPPPLVVALTEGPLRERVCQALQGVSELRSAGHWSEVVTEEHTHGAVLVDAQMAPEELGRLLQRMMALPGAWAAVLVGPDPDDRLVCTPLSPGFPLPLSDAAKGDGGAGGQRYMMRALSRARHDINNPLTSALAEVQLLLLDGESDPGLSESLDIVQQQLRRIRDLIIGLSRFRPPS